jgi:DNA-directed RNA polymerase specialized sigma24 family protein
MSVPQVTVSAGVFSFSWGPENLHIRVDKIRQHKTGYVTGEVTITTSAPGYSPHLFQAQHNLSSLRARTDLVKLMDERYDKANWDEVLEQLSVITLERLRAGEPIRVAGLGNELHEPSYLLYPLLPKSLPTLFYGEGGVAKSYFALFLALSVQLPYEEWDWFPHQANALYLDYETDFEEVDYRSKRIKRGLSMPEELSIRYRRCALPLADDLSEIQRAIADGNIGLVVVDSLGAACGGDLNSAEVATRFFGALRQLPVTSLLISHVSKSKETKDKTPYGSVYFYNFARNVFELRRIQEAEQDEINLGVFHRKNNLGKLHYPLGFTVRFETDRTVFQKQDIRDIPEFLETLSNAVRIEALLKHGTMSVAEIAEELDITAGSVRVTLNRLKDRGKAIKVGEKWGLPAY